jgi:hypothetical protein
MVGHARSFKHETLKKRLPPNDVRTALCAFLNRRSRTKGISIHFEREIGCGLRGLKKMLRSKLNRQLELLKRMSDPMAHAQMMGRISIRENDNNQETREPLEARLSSRHEKIIIAPTTARDCPHRVSREGI